MKNEYFTKKWESSKHSTSWSKCKNKIKYKNYVSFLIFYFQTERSDDEDNDSTSSEEIEPKLKYQRMSNDLKNILTKDAVSCITVHPKVSIIIIFISLHFWFKWIFLYKILLFVKFICVGSLWGMIHILDHQGNNVGTKELQAHTVAVNQISIDDNGDFLASCSDDGKVFVHGLYSADNNHNMEMGRSVKSIALDPAYFKSGSGRRFITGIIF